MTVDRHATEHRSRFRDREDGAAAAPTDRPAPALHGLEEVQPVAVQKLLDLDVERELEPARTAPRS
jgi:hypothetical protein